MSNEKIKKNWNNGHLQKSYCRELTKKDIHHEET